jgi:hypothetical protein
MLRDGGAATAGGSIKQILTLAGQLGRWVQNADVTFSQIASAAVESFLDALRARGVRRVPGQGNTIAGAHGVRRAGRPPPRARVAAG